MGTPSLVNLSDHNLVCGRISKRIVAANGAAIGLLLSGCSTIKSDALDAATVPSTAGLVYYMPIRTLAVDSKFLILDCGRKAGQDKAELLYDVRPTVTAAVAADRARAFTIARGLDGKFLKSLNFEITQYENGTLKGVNVVADDRTAETATNVLSGALKLGLSLTGNGLFSLTNRQDETVWLRDLDETADKAKVDKVREVCGKATTDALLRVHKLTRSLSGAREAAEAKGKLSAAVTEAEKAVVDARAALKAAKEAGGTEDVTLAEATLKEAVNALVKARKAAKEAGDATAMTAIGQDIAATVQRHLTYSASKLAIPTETEQPFTDVIIYSAKDLQSAGIPGAQSDLMAAIELKPVSAAGTAEASAVIANQVIPVGTRADGIWFRSPATAHFRVCLAACGKDDITTRLSQVVTVPQWGQLSRLPLRNMAFAKNTTKLSFAPDGTLLSLGAESTAPGERASAAFAQSGEMLLDYATKRRALQAELAAASTASEKAALQHQLDLLSLNQQIAAVQSTVGPERESQLAALSFQIQQVQKQIELLELQKKLETLQSSPE